jgi:hypothetical protein
MSPADRRCLASVQLQIVIRRYRCSISRPRERLSVSAFRRGKRTREAEQVQATPADSFDSEFKKKVVYESSDARLS